MSKHKSDVVGLVNSKEPKVKEFAEILREAGRIYAAKPGRKQSVPDNTKKKKG